MEGRTLEERRSATVGRILDAARDVFAEAGFAGARVDVIARRAGVNKAMIYYRIGDKEALYASVLHEVFSDSADRIARHIERGGAPEDKLKAYIQNLSRTMEENPWVPPIMIRELASGAGHFPEIVIRDVARLLEILSDILDEGVRRGEFMEVNPFLIHMMLVGAMVILRKVKALEAGHEDLPANLSLMVGRISGDLAADLTALILRAVKRT